MKNLKYIAFIVLTSSIIFSCSQYSRTPGRIYAPDMTYSKAVEFYHDTTKINAAGGTFNKMPAKGSIAREQPMPDHIDEMDTLIAKSNTCSLVLNVKDLDEGKRLYSIYCAICHGTNIDGNGPLFASGKFAAMPANLKLEKYLHMSQGTMYHAIVYGKNAMGSYAGQLDTRQRWQIVAYIKKTQSTEASGEAFTMIKTIDTNKTK